MGFTKNGTEAFLMLSMMYPTVSAGMHVPSAKWRRYWKSSIEGASPAGGLSEAGADADADVDADANAEGGGYIASTCLDLHPELRPVRMADRYFLAPQQAAAFGL